MDDNLKTGKTITEERKLAIINVMCLAFSGKITSKEILINSLAKTPEEKEFASQVYEEATKIVQSVKDLNLRQIEVKEQVKIALCNRFGISNQAQIEEQKRREEKINELKQDLQAKRQKWQEQDASEQIQEQMTPDSKNQTPEEIQGSISQQGETAKTDKGERKGFWDKESSKQKLEEFSNRVEQVLDATTKEQVNIFQLFDGTQSRNVQLVRYHPNDLNGANKIYSVNETQCIIQEIGQLIYQDTPTLNESVPEYEIIIKRKEEQAVKFRRFGHIMLNQMIVQKEDGEQQLTDYGEAVLTKLLGRENLENRELEGYIGRLIQDPNNKMLETKYVMAHCLEEEPTDMSRKEYTAVKIWRQLEKEGKRPINLCAKAQRKDPPRGFDRDE